jgi:hypothetical protein
MTRFETCEDAPVKVGRPAGGCRNCGAPGRRRRERSAGGYCRVCGPAVAEKAQWEMHFHDGPTFEKWRRSMAASVGALLPDDLAALIEERM